MSDASRKRNWGVAAGVAFVLVVGTVVGVLGGKITQRAPRAAGTRVVVLDLDGGFGVAWVQDAVSRALDGTPGLSVVNVEELRARRVTLLRAHRSAGIPDAIDALALDVVVTASVHADALHIDAKNAAGTVLGSADGALDLDAVFRTARALAPKLSKAEGVSPTAPPPTLSVEAYRAFGAAIAAWDAGDVDTTIVKLREATALDDGFAPAWAALATALDVSAGAGFAEAVAKAEANRAKLSGVEAFLVDAQQAALAGRQEDQLAALRAATVAFPEDRAGHFALGRAYNRTLGAHDEALHHLEIARRLSPDWFLVTAEIAEAWLAMGDRKHASQAVRGFLVLVPDDARAKALLTRLNETAPPLP